MSTTPKTCDICGASEYSTFVGSLESHRFSEFPEDADYEHLCNDCAEDENTLSPETMTDGELIAAIVSDSIGYATPRHAAFHVRDFRDGKEGVFCERGTACFGNDMQKMMDRAARHWGCLSEEKRERLLTKVEKWREIENESRIASLGLSMSVPVGGL